MPDIRKGRLSAWLERAPAAAFSAYAIGAAFTCYFCMYAFRKPFTVAEFTGQEIFDRDLKPLIVISQVIGYAIAKFLGIKMCSELAHRHRAIALVGLIIGAELSLIAFGLVPDSWKLVPIFFNGLALGMVWGFVVGFLEGRRLSDLLMAGLCCSFIVASGVVKDTGKWLMSAYDITEGWMPAWTGMLYIVPFLVSVWLLQQIPRPSTDDIAERTRRAPMSREDRIRFMKDYAFGFSLAIFVYMMLTAIRDIRDNYGIDIFRQLGMAEEPALFTRTEVPIAFAVVLPMALLTMVRDNRKGLLLAYGVMVFGTLSLFASTLAFDAGLIDGLWWMILTGVGAYLAYVPYNAVLFERMMASTGFAGTAVFCIYVADTMGYVPSIGFQFWKPADLDYVSFFRWLTYGMGTVSVACLVLSAAYFARRIEK